MKKSTVRVFDAQQGRHLEVETNRASVLCAKYPTRFSVDFQSLTHFKTGDNIMPQLPQETKKFNNGAHVVTAIEVKTTQGQYGPQEEVTCADDKGEMTRIWVAHNSRKKIIAAAKAGLVDVHEDDSWEVIIGARFQILVAGGKVVALTEAPRTVPAPATGQ